MQTHLRTAWLLCIAAMSLTGSFAQPALDSKAKPLCSLLTQQDAQRIKGAPLVLANANSTECVYAPPQYGGAGIDMVGIAVEHNSTWAAEKQAITGLAKMWNANIENLPGIGDDALLFYSKDRGGATFLEFHKGQRIFKLSSYLPDGKFEPLKQVAKKIADSSAISNIK